MMASPIDVEAFYHDGRGPEIRRIHWGRGGRELLAIDYSLPDAGPGEADLRHVQLVGVQVVLLTPDEVIGDHSQASLYAQHAPAAMFDLGRDDWFAGFYPKHLDNCRHFQLFFYDELLDVICERIECGRGAFAG